MPPVNVRAGDLNAPSDLACTDQTQSDRLSFGWTVRSTTESLFRFQLSADPQLAVGVSEDTVGPGVTGYVQSGLSPETTYYARVRAERGAVVTAWTAVASGTTAATPGGGPVAPTLQSAVLADAGDVLTLTFSDPVTSANSFAGFTLHVNAGTQTPAYTSGNTTAQIIMAVSPAVPSPSTATLSLDYSDATGDVHDADPLDLTSFTGFAVTVGVPPAPAAPTLNSATEVSGAVRLSVTPNDSSADRFFILRTAGQNYHEVGQAAGTASPFTWDDATVRPGRTYRYKVFASRTDAPNSAYSGTKDITTTDFSSATPGTPTNVRVLAQSTTELYVDWHVPDTGATGTVLAVSSDGGSTYPATVNVPAGWTFAVLTGLTAGVTRFVKVKQTNGGGSVSGSYSTPASGTTLASGVYAPSGTNPKFYWTRGLYENWAAAKAAWEANNADPGMPARSWGEVVANSNLIVTADQATDVYADPEPYGTSVFYCCVRYVLTGDSQWAVKAFNRMPFNQTAAAAVPSNRIFWQATVTGVTDSQHVQLDVTDHNYVDHKVWWDTGNNSDVAYEARRVTACVAGAVTFDAPLDQTPQVGDVLVGVYDLNITQNLSQTQHVPFWTLPFALVYPGLNAAQKKKWTQFLNTVAETAVGTRNRPYVGGFGPGDSDQTTSNYFGLAIWDVLGPEVGNTRTAFTAQSYGTLPIGGAGTVSGFADFSTVRKAIACYAAMADGGSWIESINYNIDTVLHAAWGARTLYTATGTDTFPELTRCLVECARVIGRSLTPNRAFQTKWGDIDAGHNGLWQPNLTSSLALMSTFAVGHDDVSPYLADLVYQLWIAAAGYAPYGDRLGTFDPTISRTSYLSMPLYHPGGSDGRYETTLRNGSLSTDSVSGITSFCRAGVDHSTTYLANPTVYRNGERVIRFPEAYSNLSGGMFGYNNVVASGLDIQAFYGWGGPHAAAGSTTWAYIGASTGGPYYSTDVVYPCPPAYLHEMSRAVVVLPGTAAKHSDVVVVRDRVRLQDPRKLPLTKYYTSEAYAGPLTVQASPAPTATSIGTNLDGGASADLLAGRHWLFLDNGTQADKPAKVVASTAGANSVLTLRAGDLSGAPAAGNTGYIYIAGVLNDLLRPDALAMQVWQAEVNPTLASGKTTWTTTGGQKAEVVHVLPASIQRRAYAILTEFPGSAEPSEGKYTALVYGPTAFPADNTVQYYRFLSVASASDDTYQPAVTGLTGTGGVADGVLVTRAGENDWVLMFGAQQLGRVLFAGYSVTYTQTTATADVLLADLDPHKTWTYTVDGGGSNGLTVVGGTAKFTVSGAGAHTLAVSAA